MGVNKTNIYTDHVDSRLYKVAELLITWQGNLMKGRVLPNDIKKSIEKLDNVEGFDNCCPSTDSVVYDSWDYKVQINDINKVLDEIFFIKDIGAIKSIMQSGKPEEYS